jgi:hypothetical protein
VNALALVGQHPEGVRTLVAHEPPLATVLPDREEALAVTQDIHETYERDGLGPAMAKFIAFTSVRGPTPPDRRLMARRQQSRCRVARMDTAGTGIAVDGTPLNAVEQLPRNGSGAARQAYESASRAPADAVARALSSLLA